MHKSLSYLLLACCLIGGWAHAAEPKVPPLYQQPKWWWSLLGPAEPNPADQLTYADQLADKGRTRKAIRHYRRLANFWPDAPEAPAALIDAAGLYVDKGKLSHAFNTYQEVIDRYAGSFEYLNIVKQQVMLVKDMEQERFGGLWIFGGFKAPERALPYYQQIITNAPQWEKVAELQFTIGAIQEEVKEYKLAIEAYDTALSRFPDSPWAEPASFHKALCMANIAKERPNDDAAAENAWATLTQYLNNYAGSENSAEALNLQKKMRDRLAKSYFDKAHYYDTIARRPNSALIAYKSFIEQFPTSEWTEQAQSRIEAIEATTTHHNHDEEHPTHTGQHHSNHNH